MKKTLSSLSVLMIVGAAPSSFSGCDSEKSAGFTGTSKAVEQSLRNLSDQNSVDFDGLGSLRTEGRMSGELLAASLKGMQDQIDALKKKDEELAREINDVRTSLSERIAAVEARVKLLEEDSNRKAEQILSLSSRMAVAEALIEGNLGGISAIQDEIAAIRDDLQQNFATDEELRADVERAQQQIDDINRDLVQNYATKAELAELKDAQKKIQDNLSLLNSELYGEDEFDKLLEMAESPDGLRSRLDSIDTQMQGALNRIAANEDAIQVHADLLAQYRSDFDILKENIDKKFIEVEEAIARGNADINNILDDIFVDLGEMNVRINNSSANIGSFFEAATGGRYNEADTQAMQSEIAAYFNATRDFETQTVNRLNQLDEDVATAQSRADAAYALAERNRSDLEDNYNELTGRIDGLEGALNDFKNEITGSFNTLQGQVTDMLDGRTPDEFAEQFANTVQELGTLKTQFSALEQGLDARILNHIADETADLNERVAALELVQSVTNIQVPAATNFLREYSTESLRLLSTFVDVIAPASGSAHAQNLSNTFQRDVIDGAPNNVCSSFTNAQADFKNIFGDDYFMILARYYAEAFAHGWRNGDGAGGIFHGMPGFTGDSNELLRMTLEPLFRISLPPAESDAAQQNAATCLAEVRDWANDILFGDEEVARAFQDELTRNQTLRAQLETLNVIGNQAAEPLEVIASTISGEFPAAFQQLQAEVAMHTQQILALEQRMQNAENRMDSEFVTATQFAEFTDQHGQNNTSIQFQFNGIETTLEGLAGEFEEFKAKQAGANAQLFGMVAAMATELGMEDIANRAFANIVPINTPSAIPPPTGTTSGVGIHNAGLSYTECSNLAGTSGYSTGGWLSNQFAWMGDQCSVNFRSIASADIPETLTLGGFRLRIATTGVAQVDVQTQLGNGWQETTSLIDGTQRSGSFDLRGAGEKVTAVAGDWIVGLFDLDVAHLIAGSLEGSANKRVRFTIRGYGPDDADAGEPIVIDIGFYSPVILNFAGTNSVATSVAMSSGVRFDLNADGKPEQTGWLARGATAGFLAMDLNGNGKIDDGSELFGEATAVRENERALNGYRALAELDQNKDGRVDTKDEKFAQLLVWFDRNLDGHTDKGELVSITQAGVTALSTQYAEVTDSQKRARSVFENDHRYEARFWGPKQCGEEGCATFDIYFSKSHEFTKK